MNNTLNFSQFRHQSKKGIVIIYLNLLYKVFKAFWLLLFLFIQKFAKIPENTLTFIYIGLGFLLLFFLIRAFLIFKNFQFKIYNNHFILKKGILKKTNTSIPFDRIQTINFEQNLIHQAFNVVSLEIDSAGSNQKEIKLQAIKREALLLTLLIYTLKYTYHTPIVVGIADSEIFSTSIIFVESLISIFDICGLDAN